MGLFGIVFGIIFVLVFVNVVRGMWATSRLSNKVFDMVERQLDQQLSASRPATKVECPFCRSSIDSAEKCPNCGASLRE